VQLTGLNDRYPRQLSGGQQQRVALARALIFRPPVLLMDEPFGALDRSLRESMQGELRRLHGRLGVTILFVTHGISEAVDRCKATLLILPVVHPGKRLLPSRSEKIARAVKVPVLFLKGVTLTSGLPEPMPERACEIN
jgi:ABC-type nitrate/sulfonate/bicarbonate transport system ATPase subunit